MRYMRSLNDWLGRDVRDRQNEMQAISARVDALRGDLARLLGAGGGKYFLFQPRVNISEVNK